LNDLGPINPAPTNLASNALVLSNHASSGPAQNNRDRSNLVSSNLDRNLNRGRSNRVPNAPLLAWNVRSRELNVPLHESNVRNLAPSDLKRELNGRSRRRVSRSNPASNDLNLALNDRNREQSVRNLGSNARLPEPSVRSRGRKTLRRGRRAILAEATKTAAGEDEAANNLVFRWSYPPLFFYVKGKV
jgi:hypothetical protein